MTDTTAYEDQFDWDDPVGGGGLLAHYTAIIRNPSFGVDADYRDDTTRLILNLEVTVQPDPDVEVEVGHVFTEGFNLGKTTSWEAVDGGAAAARVDGKRAKAHPSSGMGKLLNAITGKHYGDEAKSKLAGREKLIDILRERGSGMRAATWADLEFEWSRLEFSFENDDDEVITYTQVFPTKFVGVADPASGEATSSNGAVSDKDWGDILAELTEEAKKHDSFAAFFKAAMQQHPDLATSPIAEDVMDKDGVYAAAHA